MAQVTFDGVGKVYGDRTPAVSNLDLEVAEGKLHFFELETETAVAAEAAAG